jgi:hypothetical protein
MEWAALGIEGMAADGGMIPGSNRSLRFGKWIECYWQNAVASTYESGKALHILVIQLLHGHTTNRSLHEYCNY